MLTGTDWLNVVIYLHYFQCGRLHTVSPRSLFTIFNAFPKYEYIYIYVSMLEMQF